MACLGAHALLQLAALVANLPGLLAAVGFITALAPSRAATGQAHKLLFHARQLARKPKA